MPPDVMSDPVIDIKRLGIELHAGEPCPEVPRETPVGDSPVAVKNAGVGERVCAETQSRHFLSVIRRFLKRPDQRGGGYLPGIRPVRHQDGIRVIQRFKPG